jgi:vacuolar protein sorting-associated protein 35
LITKAALHAAKLLKKPHQATGVHLASHLWWQEAVAVGEEESEEVVGKDLEKSVLKEDGEGAKAVCPSFLICFSLILMKFYLFL